MNLTAYFSRGEPHRTWGIGPLGAWKVGDELPIPVRPAWFAQELPGCELARVTKVDQDGLAWATDVAVLDAEEAA